MTTASTVCYKKMRMTTGEKEQVIKNKVCMYPLKGGRTRIPKYTLSHYILTDQWVPAQKQNANIIFFLTTASKNKSKKNWQADVKRSAPRETLVTNSFTSLVAMLIITSLSHCHDNPYLSARLSWQSLPLCQVVATTLTSLLCDGFFADIQPDKLLHLWLPLQSWHLCLVVTTILTSLLVCHNNPDLSVCLSQQSWPICPVVTTILTSLPGCRNNPYLSAMWWFLCQYPTWQTASPLVAITILTSLPGCHNNPDLSAQLSQQSWPLCPVVATILTSLPGCRNNPYLSAMWWFLCQCPAWRTASPLLQSTPQAPSWWCPASGNTGTDSRQWITVNLPILGNNNRETFFEAAFPKGTKTELKTL